MLRQLQLHLTIYNYTELSERSTLFVQYYPYVISYSEGLMSHLIDNQANRQVDDNGGSEAKDRGEDKNYPQQVDVHAAPLCKPRADTHQLAICFVEFQLVFHRTVSFIVGDGWFGPVFWRGWLMFSVWHQITSEDEWLTAGMMLAPRNKAADAIAPNAARNEFWRV